MQNTNLRRMPQASSKLKQEIVKIYLESGMQKAQEVSNYSQKAIYKWVQKQKQGQLQNESDSRVITEEKFNKATNDPSFYKNLSTIEKMAKKEAIAEFKNILESGEVQNVNIKQKYELIYVIGIYPTFLCNKLNVKYKNYRFHVSKNIKCK